MSDKKHPTKCRLRSGKDTMTESEKENSFMGNKNGINISKKALVIILLVFALLIAAATFVIVKVVKDNRNLQNTNETATDTGIGISFEKNQSGELVVKEQEETEKKPNVAIPGWGSFNVKAGEKETQITFYNPEKNEGYYYLTFSIMIPIEKKSEEYETIYTSGLIEPGNYVQNITLDRALDEGTYDAIVHCQPYTISDNPVAVNNANMRTTIVAS